LDLLIASASFNRNFWMEEQQAHKPAVSTAAEAAAEAAVAVEAASAA